MNLHQRKINVIPRELIEQNRKQKSITRVPAYKWKLHFYTLVELITSLSEYFLNVATALGLPAITLLLLQQLNCLGECNLCKI